MKIRLPLLVAHCCYAVVGLVLLASILTSAEIEEERSFATTTDQIQTSVGLSLSGGYLAASLHGASIMRGIQQQKVEIDGKMRPAMEAFDYMAGLSGGNVPIVLYSYAQTMDGTEFLDAEGEVTAPQDITAKKLRHMKKGSMFHIFTRRLWLRAIPVLLSEKFFKTKSVSIFTLTLYFAIIKPIGIKRNQFFGPTELGKNKNFVGIREDVKATPITTFGCVGPHEIYPKNTYADVSKTTVIGSKAGIFSVEDVETSLSKNGNLTSVLFSATPYEVVSHYDRSMSFDTIAPPNTIVEPLNFPVHPTKPWEWGSKKQRFSLEMLLGAGTNFMGFFQGHLGVQYNQVREVDVTGNGDTRKLMLMDGGTNLLDGIPSLVQKRVRKIVHVHFDLGFNQRNPGFSYAEIYNSTNLNEWMTNMNVDALGTYFGMGYTTISNAMNLIFDDGYNHMKTLRSNLDSLYEADNPLITTLENITVLDNPFWGTTAGDKVDLTFIMLTLPGKFSSKIHRDAAPPPKGIKNIVDRNGRFTNKELSAIPNISVMANSEKAIIARGFRFAAFTVRQANMMAYLGSWIVDQAWDKPLLGEDGKEKFGGFKAILEKN